MAPTDPAPGGRRPLRPVQVVLVVVAVVIALVVGNRLLGSPSGPADRADTPTPAPVKTDAPDTVDRLSKDVSDDNRGLSRCSVNAVGLSDCGRAPSLSGVTRWFGLIGGQGSDRVDLGALRGHVVLLDFFSYSCGACRRDQSYLSRWDATYARSGLRVIGVQSPQWDFERNEANVAAAVRQLDIHYPVGLDRDAKVFDRYRSTSRPAKYLIDATGRVRAIGYGMGDYVRTESQIRRLLLQADPGRALPRRTALLPPGESDGQSAQIDFGYAGTPSSYRGGPRLIDGRATRYAFADGLEQSQFTLSGEWTSQGQYLLAGRRARLRVSFATMRASMVVAGRGTLTLGESGRPVRRVPVSGTPGPVLVFTGRLDLGKPVTFGATPGLRLYALSVR